MSTPHSEGEACRPDNIRCEGPHYGEAKHSGWLERYDAAGLDEVFVDAPIKCFHLERMDVGAWWMRLDLHDGRGVVVNLCAKRPSRTEVSGMVEEERA